MHRPYYLGTSTILNIACIKIILLSLIAVMKFEVFMNHIPQYGSHFYFWEDKTIVSPENVINNYYQLMDKYLKLVVSGRNHDNQNGVQLQNMKIHTFCEVK